MKEKTRDDKLREAAEKYGRKNYDFSEYRSIAISSFEDGAEYHRSIQSVASKALETKFKTEMLSNFLHAVDCGSDAARLSDIIFDWFLPYLQPPMPESDIIRKDFIGFNSYLWNKGFVKSGKVDYSQMLVYMEDYITEYKQSKTNSDGK